MKTFITILTLLFLTACSQPFGGGITNSEITDTVLTEIPPITQTKTGDFAFNEFQNLKTGEKIKVSITKMEYQALGAKGAKQPVLEGYKWIGAEAGDVIATSTPTLSDYQYYYAGKGEASSTLVMIKIPDKQVQVIKKDYIVNNKLTSEGLTKIK